MALWPDRAFPDDTDLSEFAGRLVLGLKMETCLKARYMRYTRPTLNTVKMSNSLHTKWPPGWSVIRIDQRQERRQRREGIITRCRQSHEACSCSKGGKRDEHTTLVNATFSTSSFGSFKSEVPCTSARLLPSV